MFKKTTVVDPVNVCFHLGDWPEYDSRTKEAIDWANLLKVAFNGKPTKTSLLKKLWCHIKHKKKWIANDLSSAVAVFKCKRCNKIRTVCLRK